MKEGKFGDTGKTFNTVNPATEQIRKTYSYMTDEQINQQLATAVKGGESWAQKSVKERAPFAARFADALEEAKTELARIATEEMGKPLTQSLKEVEKSATCCRYYAEHAAEFLADEPALVAPARGYVTFRPLGPILCIMPWNFPFWQVVRFAVPALMAGNAVILKHAEITTGVGAFLEGIFQRIFPPELFRMLLATHEQLARVIADSRIKAVTLTGSEKAGREVAALAGQHLKKSVLELGGSDPYLVLADADVAAAAKICAEARLVNSGQSCVAAKRFIVHDSIYEAFCEALVARVKTYKCGDPTANDVQVGPLARVDLRDSLAAQVDSSVFKGAKVLLGGKARPGAGFYYEPTVLIDVQPGMAVFDEETFGPVAAVIKAKSDDDAIRLANQSTFGLGGAIFSRDSKRAEVLARDHLEAGLVAINSMVVSDPRLPFGGVKSSGYGRELGRFGIREFVNVKSVVVA